MENPIEKTGESLANKVKKQCYFTILAPNSIRANTDFVISLTIHEITSELNEAVVVRVGVEDEDDEEGMIIHRDVTLKLNVTESITIPIGDISLDRNYKFVAKGISGVTLDKEAHLNIQTKTKSIFIQTDKAIYKPSDTIKFRVLVLDSELKAAAINNNELQICFTVSRQIACFTTYLIAFDNIKLVHGQYNYINFIQKLTFNTFISQP